MKRLIIAAVLAAWPISAAAQATPRVARNPAELWPERGVVLPDHAMPQLLRWNCSRPKPDSTSVQGFWRPTYAQIRELEARLAPLLRERIPRQRLIEAPDEGPHPILLSLYYRQYAGFVIGGRRIIYVNAFVAGFNDGRGGGPSWRTMADGYVCDGGSGFFGVEYDPQTKRFSNLFFNLSG